VCLQGKAPVALVGLGDAVADVRIVADRFAGQPKRAGVEGGNPCLPDLGASAYGTFSSATLGVFSDDVQLTHLTVENDAMNGVRRGVGWTASTCTAWPLLSHRDTLYCAQAAATGSMCRAWWRGCEFHLRQRHLVMDDSTI
jgi:pectin methylesterase-like acyl-CoA thioesterase